MYMLVWGLSISPQQVNKIEIFQNIVLRVVTKSPWVVRNDQIQNYPGINPVTTIIRRSVEKLLFVKYLILTLCLVKEFSNFIIRPWT